MKFEGGTEEFSKSVMVVVRFIERRANLPVLSSILILAEKGRVTLRATNLECGVELVVPARVHTEGAAAVPGAVLSGFMANARGKNITASLQGEILRLETSAAQASIKTLPHDDFPVLPRVSASTSFTVKAADLARAIRSVIFCSSTSAVKPELQSVLIYGEGGRLIAAATDSFRLAEKSVPLRSSGSVPQLLIPARNAGEYLRLLEGAGSDTDVYYNEHQLSTHLGSAYFTSRLIDGAFPNYRQIIPKTFSTEAVVLREDFSTALKSLTVFSDKFLQVTLTVDPPRKSLLLSSRNPDVGEQVSTLRATILGDGLMMNFNSRYLMDSLQAISGESVRIHANGPGKPILIKDAADDSYFYLAMPMNR